MEIGRSDMLLTDQEINRLINIPKRITNPRARPKEDRKTQSLKYNIVSGEHKFEMYIRQNLRLSSSFSCGLIYYPTNGDKITLMRCNGYDHRHTNPIEGGEVLDRVCHIHIATQRYIEAGRKADQYAEITDAYTDIHGAVRTLLSKCNIEGLPTAAQKNQLNLFNGTSY